MAENAVREDADLTSTGADADRPELAAMIGPLLRNLAAAEKQILDAHSLTMCGYAVLLHLGAASSAMTQVALTEAVGAGRTRVAAVAFELENRGSVRCRPGSVEGLGSEGWSGAEGWSGPDAGLRSGTVPDELLSITPEGRRLRDTVRSAIRSAEDRLLDRLPAADREGFVRALRTLSVSAIP